MASHEDTSGSFNTPGQQPSLQELQNHILSLQAQVASHFRWVFDLAYHPQLTLLGIATAVFLRSYFTKFGLIFHCFYPQRAAEVGIFLPGNGRHVENMTVHSYYVGRSLRLDPLISKCLYGEAHAARSNSTRIFTGKFLSTIHFFISLKSCGKVGRRMAAIVHVATCA